MTAPVLVQTYPANNDVGIPVGITMLVYFDNVVDEQKIKDSIILHGPDFDFATGPFGTNYIREDGAENPYFLTSPGFSGVAPLKIQLAYYDKGTMDIVEPALADTLTEAAASAANIAHVAQVTLAPEFNAQFAADTKYTLSIIGDPDSQGIGVTTRTVYPIEPVAVAGDGSTDVTGTYTGLAADTIHVKITRAGDINEAKYKYWYASMGEGTAITGRLASSKFKMLESGISLRFAGENFIIDDEWRFAVAPIQRMATSTQVVFTTNDGSYSLPPDSPSTPAPSLPPSNVLPGIDPAYDFAVVSMNPENGSYGNDGLDEIVIKFSNNVDPASITDETLQLTVMSVDGLYDCTDPPRELKYTWTLVDNVLTIRI